VGSAQPLRPPLIQGIIVLVPVRADRRFLASALFGDEMAELRNRDKRDVIRQAESIELDSLGVNDKTAQNIRRESR
jgi:hypothetical protein